MSRVTKQLLEWEKDFHGHDYNEVLKCWRLHLGSSEILKFLIASVENKEKGDQESATASCESKYLFYKSKFRNWRYREAPNWFKQARYVI